MNETDTFYLPLQRTYFNARVFRIEGSVENQVRPVSIENILGQKRCEAFFQTLAQFDGVQVAMGTVPVETAPHQRLENTTHFALPMIDESKYPCALGPEVLLQRAQQLDHQIGLPGPGRLNYHIFAFKLKAETFVDQGRKNHQKRVWSVLEHSQD